VLDIHNMLDEPDRRYFRESRTRALGRPLEDVVANREDEIAAFPALLAPIRRMLSFQPFIGGTSPLFSDYIVFGALQWARITTGADLFSDNDPVRDWFEGCLDLYDARGRSVTAA